MWLQAFVVVDEGTSMMSMYDFYEQYCLNTLKINFNAYLWDFLTNHSRYWKQKNLNVWETNSLLTVPGGSFVVVFYCLFLVSEFR